MVRFHSSDFSYLWTKTIHKLTHKSIVRINNKAGPHNVVFDEDNIPDGVDQEKISMDDQLGEPGDTFEMSFDTAGTYGYYCEPHRGAGMVGQVIVE